MENQILPYVDGRLKESEKLRVEKHLADCAACRLRVSEFRAVSGLIDELPQIEPSEAFDLRVRARVAAEPVKKSWWAWYVPSPRVVFAATALLLAMVWFGSRPVVLNPTPGNTAHTIDPNDLPVLENYDILANFEPLTELPPPVQADTDDDQPDS
jgi:anti-sigma factor RsiW